METEASLGDCYAQSKNNIGSISLNLTAIISEADT